MERRNYFDMLELNFDPPEKNERRIQKALEEWKKQTEDALAGEQDGSRRKILSAELDLYGDMEKTLKDAKSRNAEARAKKEHCISQLEQLIDIMLMGQTGTPEVTNAQIRNINIKLKLAPNTIENIYTKKGFVIQSRAKTIQLNEVFLSPAVSRTIVGRLEQLRSMDIPKYPWTNGVRDLYDFACYFSGGSKDDTESFHRKRTTELYSIMESGAMQFASDMSPQGHLLADLFTSGTTQVFDSEMNRKRYDQTLEAEKLKDFFALLKTAPQDFKKDRYFAESCIRTIQKSFSDFDLSLALYNREAGLLQDPYEPFEALIHVTCGTCKTPAEFRTHEEAEKGICPVCKAALYVECPKCHKKVPASADRCVCGFHIIEMQFFEEYYNGARFALKEMDLAEARKQLANAENAYPGNPKLAALKRQIQEESDRYQKPLDDLKALISAGMFAKAQTLLGTIAASMPRLKLDGQRKVISEKLALVQNMMPLQTWDPEEKANRCIEILQIVKDYQPAIDMLMVLRPGKPLGLHASVSEGARLSCTLTWNASGDKGVSYRVVRKKGKPPCRQTDGEVLAADLERLEWKDTTLEPGISYGYAVFACRRGIFSEPAVCKIEDFSELDPAGIHAVAECAACRFSWTLPVNCIGVRILKSINAIPEEMPSAKSKTIVDRASAHFDDKDVVNDTAYGYRLQCVYPHDNGFRYSKGYTVMLTPEQPPVSLRGIGAKVEGRTVTVRWKDPGAMQCQVSVREVKGASADPLIGQVVLASDLNSILGNGRIYANTTSSAMQCRFEIPPNTAVRLAVVTAAGSKGIVSEIVAVSSVEKCEINKAETRMEGNRLKIMIADIPGNLERIHYIVARKAGDKAPWATIEDARRNLLTVVTAQEYQRDGMILEEFPPRSDLYISVVGQYKMPDGSTAYSEPSKLRISNKPKEKIRYCLSWGSGLFSSRPKPKGCRLFVSSAASETPVLKLVYRTDGHIPMKLSDPKTVALYTIPEMDEGFPDGRYTYIFPDSTWESIRPGTELRLMLSENDMPGYEIAPDDVKSLKVPER